MARYNLEKTETESLEDKQDKTSIYSFEFTMEPYLIVLMNLRAIIETKRCKLRKSRWDDQKCADSSNYYLFVISAIAFFCEYVVQQHRKWWADCKSYVFVSSSQKREARELIYTN